MPGAEQGQHHLAVEEAAAVEQREDEIDVRLLEQRLVAVGEHEVEAEPLEDLARLVMVERVVAVLRMEAARPLACLAMNRIRSRSLASSGIEARFDGVFTGKAAFRTQNAGRLCFVRPARYGRPLVASSKARKDKDETRRNGARQAGASSAGRPPQLRLRVTYITAASATKSISEPISSE